MDSPMIRVYSKESVIVDQFETMLYLAELNSRMKDFYDIYSLCTSFDFDGRVLYEAILQTITRRGTNTPAEPAVFDKAFANNKDKSIYECIVSNSCYQGVFVQNRYFQIK